jgi:hypothetical protein
MIIGFDGSGTGVASSHPLAVFDVDSQTDNMNMFDPLHDIAAGIPDFR